MLQARETAFETVVFDLDGTLADTSGDLLAAANACFADLGHGALLGPGDAGVALTGGRAMLRLGLSRLGQLDEAVVDAQYPRLLDHYARAIDTHTRLYDGARRALDRLRDDGFCLSVCTNKPEALAQTLLERLDIRGHFGALIGADTLPTRKPDPATYVAAVERAGGQVARSMLVGDTVTDRDTGRAAGVPVVLVSFGPEGAGISRLSPEALLHHFDDLPELARRLLRG